MTLLLFLVACGGSTTGSTTAPGCDAAVGVWQSVEELECGLGPNGVVLCHWSLALIADGTFDWQYSDLGEAGTWSCDTGVITAEGRSDIDGELVGADSLVWDDVTYEPMGGVAG